MDTAIRRGTGTGIAGGSKSGWKPPTESTNTASAPNAATRAISPSMVRNRMRESTIAAKK